MLPRVTIHNEISVDGRITGFSSDLHRFYLVGQRWHPDAILMGCDTVIAHFQASEAVEEAQPERLVPPDDLAEVAARHLPLLAVPDSRGRIRTWETLLQEPWWRQVVALCTEKTPPSYLEHLGELGVEYLVAGQDRVDLRRALELLHDRYEIESVLTDCGGALNGALFREGLVTQGSMLVTPSLIGGPPTSTLVDSQPLHDGEPVHLELNQLERFEDGAVWLRYDVVPVPAELVHSWSD